MVEPETQQRGRKPKWWTECSLFTRILFGLMVADLVIMGKPWFFLLRDLQSTGLYEFPPRELFINETDINQVANRSDVVQPFVGLNDIFDIAVSVWQLATSTEGSERQSLLQWKKTNGNILPDSAIPQFFTGGNATSEEEDEAFRLHSEYLGWYNLVETHEKSIFSDIVFRGLRLSDTDIHRNVTFQIPTQVFRKHPMGTNYDLRASFVIIPHSPSPLDHLKNYTSWVPVGAEGPRTKSLPFPLTSPTDYYWTPVDRLLNAFAITIPLLERHEVASMCPRTTNESVEVDEEILKKHPHVITRTHLRVARESRLFRRDAFLDKHEYLQKVSCGQMRANGVPGPVDRNLCWKKYLRNGNWETMVQLMVPDSEAVGGFREEIAYTPYMDVLRSAAGPKDIVPVPINREPCEPLGEGTVGNRSISDHMNITWHLSYSSVIPLMFLISDLDTTPLQRSHYSESDYTRAQKHDAAEFQGLNILQGHRYGEDSHPRRRLALYIVYYVASSLRILLDCEYWVSRKTLAYISVLGALCVAVRDLLQLSPLFYRDALANMITLGIALVLVCRSPQNLVSLGIGIGLAYRNPRPFLVLRAISPVELFCDGTRSLPRPRWVPSTHQERASARLDARTDWRLKCAMFTGLLIINYTLQRRFLVPPQHPPGDPSLSTILETSLLMLGWTSQLILNYRAKVYAGRYKAAVLLSVVIFLTSESYLPWFLGRGKLLEGVSYADLVWFVVLVLNCWQAWRYSSRTPEDEDAENGK